MPNLLPYTLVARCLAVLLVVTAGLKLYGLGADPVARRGIFAAPELQLAVIQVELLLAFWLGGGSRYGSWLASLTVFISFAVASAYLGWIGQTSCGCAGSLLSISPWYAFGVDLFVLAALVLGRPDLTPLWAHPSAALTSATLAATYGIGAMALFSGPLLSTVYLSFGSVPAACAYFRGERVSVGSRLVDLGSAPAATIREVTVYNWTEEPIRLIGGTADCSCTVLQDLPMEIGAGESRSVTVNVVMSRKSGIFTRKAGFLIDDHGIKQVIFHLTGRVVETATSSSTEATGPANLKPWPDEVYDETRTCQLDRRGPPNAIEGVVLIPITRSKGAFR